MNANLVAILQRIPSLKVLVVGDFFLDQYLIIEHALAEVSLETGLEAHQIVQMRCTPGGGGNVAANVRALGADVSALSVIGDDGHGYELRRALQRVGIDTSRLVVSAERATPTYTKPMLREPDRSERELNRLDVRNRSALPSAVEEQVIEHLRTCAPAVQAVIIADQVPEPDCGVITGRVRDELCALAALHPAVTFIADSRERIGLYRNVILKPNEREAMHAVYPDETQPPDDETVAACGRTLQQRCHRSVFLTMGSRGIAVYRSGGVEHVPARPVTGPIDVVGAGDTTISAVASALAAGASEREAAEIGCASAAVTIKQIGVTGTASPAQIAATLHMEMI